MEQSTPLTLKYLSRRHHSNSNEIHCSLKGKLLVRQDAIVFVFARCQACPLQRDRINGKETTQVKYIDATSSALNCWQFHYLQSYFSAVSSANVLTMPLPH